MSKNYENLLTTEYSYPSIEEEDFQNKIFEKKEFNMNRYPSRPNFTNYEELEKYRIEHCTGHSGPREHQAFIANYINPMTMYNGVLLFHGTGTGKCVHPDSIIFINDKQYNIKDIWDNELCSIIKDNDNGFWKNVEHKDYQTDSINFYGDRIKGKIKNLFKQKISEEMIIITTSSNKKIIITQKHPILTPKGWVSGSLLRPNDVCKIISNNYFVWDIIVFIEYEYYDDYVYDIEVEDFHNFICNDIVCHNTCAAITIAEQFKQQVLRYNTKIHILTPGSLVREKWIHEIVKCTGNTYKIIDSDKNLTKDEAFIESKKIIYQYYQFLNYRSFSKKVIGEKKKEEIVIDGKIKKINKTSEEGQIERELSINKIEKLDNSIIIVDEAHNITNNDIGESLRILIQNSFNLRVVLLSATPMGNGADEIIELINFLRPLDSQIEKSKVFTNDKLYDMKFKPNGLEYLKQMSRGYVSYLRGSDPIFFGERVDMGYTPEYLEFTKIVGCKMKDFQNKTYKLEVKDKDVENEKDEDALSKKGSSIANIVLPGLNSNYTELVGLFGNSGLNSLIELLKTKKEVLNKLLNIEFDTNDIEYLKLNSSENNIEGSMFHLNYLENFSTKYFQAMKLISELVEGIRGSQTAFVYSNSVKTGIEIFEIVLKENGYLEYNKEGSYSITDNTVCYCGTTHNKHDKHKHRFKPATFITLTGAINEDGENMENDEKIKTLNDVFNNTNNIQGKHIKLVLGSSVMNEGIDLQNVTKVLILDAYYTLGRIDQVIGRAIRWCMHLDLMNKDNIYPQIEIYKYAVELKNKKSIDIDLYYKAEKKHKLIKQVERGLKEVAIDCPLNMSGNIFQEEIDKYYNCDKNNTCPAICDYMKCHYKCEDNILNNNYYDPKRGIYKRIKKENLDTTTFTQSLARSDIHFAKNIIKNMFRINVAYTLENIISEVYSEYPKNKKDYFDEFFVYKALDELIPVSQNDFNNLTDYIVDSTNKPGYIIFIENYYIYQPFDLDINVPLFYRNRIENPIISTISVYDYIRDLPEFKNYIGTEETEEAYTITGYDFNSVMEYYDSREENKYIGIIDKETSHRKSKKFSDINDVFKIRRSQDKSEDKKRGTNIQTFKGSVCITNNSKEILKILKHLGLTEGTRQESCNNIKNKLLELEKYSTGKDKMTYVMIPGNHPKYVFPYNLEDRKNYIIRILDTNPTIKYNESHNYIEIINNNLSEDIMNDVIKKYKAVLTNNSWIIKID